MKATKTTQDGPPDAQAQAESQDVTASEDKLIADEIREALKNVCLEQKQQFLAMARTSQFLNHLPAAEKEEALAKLEEQANKGELDYAWIWGFIFGTDKAGDTGSVES